MIKYGKMDSINYSRDFKAVFDDLIYLNEVFSTNQSRWTIEKKYNVLKVLSRRVKSFNNVFEKVFASSIEINDEEVKTLLPDNNHSTIKEVELNKYKQDLKKVFSNLNKENYTLGKFYNAIENPHYNYVTNLLLKEFDLNFVNNLSLDAEKTARLTIANAIIDYQNTLKKLEDKQLDIASKTKLSDSMDRKILAYKEAGILQKEIDSFVAKKNNHRRI